MHLFLDKARPWSAPGLPLACPWCSLLGNATAKALVARMGASFTELNTEFGDLCDGVMDTVLDEFDRAVEGLRGGGAVIARKRAELTRAMLRELGERSGPGSCLHRERSSFVIVERRFWSLSRPTAVTGILLAFDTS